MLKTTERLIEAGLAGKVFSTVDLKRVLGVSPGSCYALVNKALKKGELLQLKRGVYLLNQKYSTKKLSVFHVACQMEPHSYISLESALSYHGWIPERVSVVTSVIHVGRTKSLKTFLGEFYYLLIPTQEYEFLTGVWRRDFDGQPFLIASPLRALMDYVYEKKLKWQGLDYLIESLRVDREQLMQMDKSGYDAMRQVYRSKRVLTYLDKLEGEVAKW